MLQNYKNVELVKPGGLDLKDRLVGVQRVTKVTKGGRAFGFSAIVVVGDENGVVGQGLGKSKEVAEAISIPVIGIGAGNGVDGQVLVTDDLIGLNKINARFDKRYSNIEKLINDAALKFKKDVVTSKFPTKKHSY